ncbi:3412_t:CDS:2, partial [Scutellospora calospora]
MATSKTKGSNSSTPTASTNTTVAVGNSTSTKHNGINSVAGELGAKRVSKGKEVVGKEIAALDFNTFDISVLRRYKRIHKLKVKDYATKEELVSAVSRHYASQAPKEVEAISAFIYS